MRQLLVPPAFERVAPLEAPNLTALNGIREPYCRTATHSADRVVEVSPSDAVSRRTANWPGMAIEIVQANRRCRIDCRYYARAPMLVFHERGARRDGCTVIEGLPKSTLQDCRQTFVFVPAGHKYYDWHEPRRLSRTLFFHFTPSPLAVGPDLGLWHLSLAPQLFFEDNALTETVLKLATLSESGPGHRRYLEALAVVLAHELVRVNTRSPRMQASIDGGLAAWRPRKATAYIEEHLAEPIYLDVLAGVVGLSARYFYRAFHRSSGMPPKRYQLNQRIERAKTLLTKRAASMTDVGLAVGYNDASSFCTAFRRVTGLTPSAYRRDLC